jgi:hypothetical protein
VILEGKDSIVNKLKQQTSSIKDQSADEIYETERDFVEDAIFCIVGMFGTNKSKDKLKFMENFPIQKALTYLENKIEEFPDKGIFKHRYCNLLSHWSDEFDLNTHISYLKII